MKTLLFVFLLATASGAPHFDEYRVPVPSSSLRKVDLTSHPKARQFRTMLGEAAKSGPNFAGKYVVARWGCGTGCLEWAIVDLESGRVFFDKKLEHLLWIVGWDTKENMDFLSFRADSDLLIAQGATDSVPNKVCRYYLRWTGTELKLLSIEVIFEDKKPNQSLQPTAPSGRG